MIARFISMNHSKKRGEIAIYENKDVSTTKIIPPGNYNLETIGKKLQEVFERKKVLITFDDENDPIVIKHEGDIIFHRDLTFLPCLNTKENKREHLKTQTVIYRLASFNNYFINCDLLDKYETFFNGRPSTVLGCFDIKGKPFERVEYSHKHHNPMRKIPSGKYIKSMRISVTDENDKLIDFNGLPLRFEFEII